MKLKNSLYALTAVVVMSFGLSPTAFADHDGGNSSGGGNPRTVLEGSLRLLITGGGLKRAMQNYLETIRPDQIEDASVRATFKRMMAGGELERELLTASPFHEATHNQPCVDAFNNAVPASTGIGKPGSAICFDIVKLEPYYSSYKEEEVMIHLASLAFHEYVHHYQAVTHDIQQIQKNEDEANRVGGYVLVTAKFTAIPVLEWAPGKGGDEFQEIQKLYQIIQAKERAFLTVPAADYKEYPDYIGKDDRGLFRLLQREKYDGKLSVSGGGAYYSFFTKASDYQAPAEIALEGGALKTGFAGCDYGFILPLGFVPLDQVNLQTGGMDFLANFKPIANDEPKIRKQQWAATVGFTQNGYTYGDITAEKLTAGQSFAVRAISFGYVDELVALHIVRVDREGNLIIAWKRLKSFAPPMTCGTSSEPEANIDPH